MRLSKNEFILIYSIIFLGIIRSWVSTGMGITEISVRTSLTVASFIWFLRANDKITISIGKIDLRPKHMVES